MRYPAVIPFVISLALIPTVFAQDAAKAPATPASPAARADVAIATALSSKNPDIRKQAVIALGLIGPRDPYLTQLEAMMVDKDVYVRLAVVASLVDLKNPRTAPILTKALNDEAPEVSFAAAKALWTLSDPKGRAALLSVLSRESKTASGAITSQKRDMLRMFHTPRTLLIFAMKEGIGAAPVPGLGEGVSSLTDLLSDPSVSGRAATALLLANDRSPDVKAALHDALADKDANVRAASVHALAIQGDPADMPSILPLLDDQKENVRLRAAAGYIRLGWIQENREMLRQFMEKDAERAKQEAKNAAAQKAAPGKKKTVPAK